MKIILLSVGILSLLFVNILAEKTITCEVQSIDFFHGCKFSGVKIGPNEAVSIKTDPESSDVSKILRVKFVNSSIHSVPGEIFQKFSDLKILDVDGNNVQEITPNTFLHAKKLEIIHLYKNDLTSLHLNSFKGVEKLRQITLHKNKLRALHPKTFSSFGNSEHLDLTNNICIDWIFSPVTSMAAIEKKLAACGANYPVFLPDLLDLENRHERKFESIENQLKIIIEKLDEREKKVDRELEQVSELFAYVYQGNKQNSAEIKEINKKVDEILEMLTSK
jgi:hypothetical protein